MKAVLVNNKKLIKEFHHFSYSLYKNDRSYIRPLEQDVEAVFDPKKNKNFNNGVIERFIFINHDNETVGKIALFINHKYKNEHPTGGFGFIDFIEEYKVASFVFDFAIEWHHSRGMKVMDGPINFGERDKFWGLLIEGFTAPLYGMNYNMPYYEAYFHRYGFQKYYEQLCFSRKINMNVDEKFLAAHHFIQKNYPSVFAENVKKNNLEKYAMDFSIIYNKAWASHGEQKSITEQQAKKIFASMKPIMDENLCWFVYDKSEPIAFWINLPDLNQWFKHLNGKFDLWHKLKFLWYKHTKKNRRAVGIVFGVVPEWQKKGIDGFMILEGTKNIITKTNYVDYEMQWIGSFNPKMIRIAQSLETTVSRKLATYRFMIEKEIPFEPLAKI